MIDEEACIPGHQLHQRHLLTMVSAPPRAVTNSARHATRPSAAAVRLSIAVGPHRYAAFRAFRPCRVRVLWPSVIVSSPHFSVTAEFVISLMPLIPLVL